MNQVSTQVIDRVEGLKDQFNQVSTHGAVTFAKECLFAKQALYSNNYLMGIAQNNPASLESAVLNIASVGLSLNPASKHAYLVPRDGRVCLDVSYMGLVHLATESGGVVWVQAQVVKQGDSFTLNAIGEKPHHSFDPFGARGEIVGVYCVVKTKDGDYLTHTMPIDAVNAIRDRSSAYKAFISKGKTCPWITDAEEMIKKTVIKQASKMWPKTGDRFNKAVEVENEINGIDFEEEQTESQKQRLVEAAKHKEAYLQAVADKAELVEKIRVELGRRTAEMKTADEKGKFMSQVCKIRSFDDLKKKNKEELQEIIDVLELTDNGGEL